MTTPESVRESAGLTTLRSGLHDSAQRPLCVDLDGTLITTDALHECIILFLSRFPHLFFYLLIWVFRGKAYFKRRLCERVSLDASLLPYREDLVEWLFEQKNQGRPLFLVTASDQSIADAVAKHLPIFEQAWGSDGETNLSGTEKGCKLVAEFGDRGFDYVGNSKTDLKIWAHSGTSFLAGAGRRLVESAASVSPVGRVFSYHRFSAQTVVKAIRVKQWVKNILVFVVIVTSHQLGNVAAWSKAALAFLAISFCASAIYLVNDLGDLAADRKHPDKRKRPLASGALPVSFGVALIPALLLAAAAFSLALPVPARVIVAAYGALSLSYSLFLKRKVLVDVFVLSILYTLRILLGAATTAIICSSWLLGFAIFFFLSLALAKRASELRNLEKRMEFSAKARAYFPWDLIQLKMFGTASAFAAGIILALYIHSREVENLYPNPEWLWIAIIGVVYWQCRIWLLVSRGALDEDPVVFAIGDRLTYFVGIAAALSAFLAAQVNTGISLIAR